MNHTKKIKTNSMVLTIEYDNQYDLTTLMDFLEDESINKEVNQLKSTIIKSQKSIRSIAKVISIPYSEISKLSNKYGLIDRINFITEKIKTEIIK